jgi:thioesterase domain-containing protein
MNAACDNSIPASEDERRDTVAESEVYAMPATPGQARFWLLSRMRPGNFALNIAIAWTCRGKLDRNVMAAALAELVRRHESLRTTFEETNRSLLQIIHPSIDLPLPLDDLHLLTHENRQQCKAAITMQHARIQMDLQKGPLFYVRLVCMEAEEHILLLTIHHSVCDGWSNGILLRDLAVIYDGLARGVAVNLPALPIQFGDYSVWLEEWRKGEEAAASRDYWLQTLGGNFSALHVPPDFPDADLDGNGEIETHLLTPDITRKMLEFCTAHGVTAYMLMFSVYATTLHRLTGQDDFLIGTPSANRPSGTEDLVGFFLNPQVTRIRLVKDQSFGELLDQVKTWTLGAWDHVNFPFQCLDDEPFYRQPKNQIDYQAYFLFEKSFMQPHQTPSLEVAPLRSVSPGLMFDLVLSIVERAEGPRLQLEYNPQRFRLSTIQKILKLYLSILDVVLSEPGNLVSGQPLDQSRKLSNDPSSDRQDHKTSDPSLSLKTPANVTSDQAIATKSKKNHLDPRNALEMQIAKIWETAMGLSNLGVQDSFFDLGGRSLAAMRIISRINNLYSLDFGVATLLSGNTIERLAELIRKRLAANTASAIVRMQTGGSATPLFIIHGAGGNIIRFYQLAKLVGINRPVYGIQAQSLLSGQSALLRVEDQAAFYLAEIRRVQPTGPYYFIGYSFGGTIAIEIAHQLRALGERVDFLGLLDSWQHDCLAEVKRHDSAREKLGRSVSRFQGNIVVLSTREKIAYLQQKILNRALYRIYALVFSLGFRSVPFFMKSADDISSISAINYRGRPWPGKLTLFRTAIQPDPRLPHDLGWTPLAKGGLDVIELPGDHDLIFREPFILQLAAQLLACLEQCDLKISTPSLVFDPNQVAIAK